jgi:ribosomal protein L37E
VSEGTASPRTAIPCPRCGTPVEGEQSWCTECGLAARTRLSATPNWRAPLVAAGAIGLAAILALVVAFLVLTGDNAPLPQTTPTAAAPADTVATTPTVPLPTTAP